MVSAEQTHIESDTAWQPLLGAEGKPRVNLRTLILIHWIALAGQLATVVVVQFLFGFDLPLAPALGVIALSGVINVTCTHYARTGRRFTQEQTAALMAYDIVQLWVLLYLTGGLVNPFSLLLLVPVTVAATVLGLRHVVMLTILTLLTLTLLAFFHLPLPWEGPFDLPMHYLLGLYLAMCLSTLFLVSYTWLVASGKRRITEAYAAAQAAMAREHQIAAVGALAAAAAHELGNPLSTITLVAGELSRDVPEDSPIAEDVALLKSQAERCRGILAELSSRRDPNAEDTPYNTQPVGALIESIAAPHHVPGRELEVLIENESAEDARLELRRRPELVHGLGNFIQNAMQFAAGQVAVRAGWDRERIRFHITDDGPGFPVSLIGRLGEPYLSGREDHSGGMGLGIFIAWTLIESLGGSVRFGNLPEGGAMVLVELPRKVLEVSKIRSAE